MTPIRQELAAIGERLVDVATDIREPIDLSAVGDLLKRLAVIYGRGVLAHEKHERRGTNK